MPMENEERQTIPCEGALLVDTGSGIKRDETCGFRASCRSKPRIFPCGMCQPLATAKWALALFCVGNMLQQTIMNGLIGVSISTLEKRFELRSTESGIITSFSDIGRGVGMIFLIFFSRNVDKPRWIGWGVIVAGIGSLLFALPHFLAAEYTFSNEDIMNYCGNVTDPDCSQSPIRGFRYLFIIAVTLIGIGMCPPYCYCLTYIDENVDKGNSALYNAILLSMGGLGPAVGFLLGGATLEMYTYITMSSDELTITSNDYSWVGAWWIGFLICGILLLINAVPVLMLPKFLPGTEKHRENRNVEAQRSHLKKNDDYAKSGPCHTISEVLLLLKNKPYIFLTLGVTMNFCFIYGFNTFGAKYLESVFGLTPFHSALIYGISAIFASAGAQLLSGYIIKKFDLDVRGMLKFTIVVGICSAICSIGFLVHCEEIDFAGGTVPYPNSTLSSISPASTCNENCGCSTDRYQPVCADGVTYFSPCFAGCSIQVNETTYADCSCVPMVNSSQTGGVASSEMCDTKPCSMIIPFVFVVIFCFFTSIMTISPSIHITLRCVPFRSRDLALPIQAAMARLAGVVPGRILVGFVLDFACVAWSTECGEQGSCKSYRRWEVARNNTILLFTQTIICALFYVLVYVTYEPAGEEKQEKEKYENVMTTKTQDKASDPSDNITSTH